MRDATAKAAFVFRYFLDRSFGRDLQNNFRSYICEATTSFDDGLDFVFAFGEAFPGRKPDGNHILARARLYQILKILSKDGWLERWRLGNEGGSPNWQYVYRLPEWLINDLKRGTKTPEQAAKEWGG